MGTTLLRLFHIQTSHLNQNYLWNYSKGWYHKRKPCWLYLLYLKQVIHFLARCQHVWFLLKVVFSCSGALAYWKLDWICLKRDNIYLQYAEAHLTHAKWQNLSNPYDGFTSTVWLTILKIIPILAQFQKCKPSSRSIALKETTPIMHLPFKPDWMGINGAGIPRPISLEAPSLCYPYSSQCLIGEYFCKTGFTNFQAPSLDEAWSFRKLWGYHQRWSALVGTRLTNFKMQRL